MPFGVELMRSPVLDRAAQALLQLPLEPILWCTAAYDDVCCAVIVPPCCSACPTAALELCTTCR